MPKGRWFGSVNSDNSPQTVKKMEWLAQMYMPNEMTKNQGRLILHLFASNSQKS